jgi:hypothetical protein
MGGLGAGNPMMMDDSMMYAGYETMHGGGPAAMYGTAAAAAPPPSMQDAEVGGMDWNYLVQLSSLSGFNPTGGYYVQGTGA